MFDQVEQLLGVLNGTCNYILTRCQRDGLDYGSALEAAQESGFAEADPYLDVSGKDTAQKLGILVGILTRRSCRAEAISCEGIEDVSSADHQAADELGFRIKLLGSYRPARMNAARGDADLGTHAELSAVRELGRCIVQDDRAVDLGKKPVGRFLIVSNDALGVA